MNRQDIKQREIAIAMDCAASEIYNEDEKVYHFMGESRMAGKEVRRILKNGAVL